MAEMDPPGGEEIAAAPAAEGYVEGSGATVADAVVAACAAAGIDAAAAEVEVLSAGSPSVPGERLSGTAARVRVRALPPEAPAALRFLRGLLDRLEIEGSVTARRPRVPAVPPPAGAPPAPATMLEIEGEDLGVLIGWRGEGLRALQTVVNLGLGREESGLPRVIVDIAQYRRRREEAVEAMARRWAARVRGTGQRITLDPMSPYERRAVHLALAADPGVRTESTGENGERRVTIHPTGVASPRDAEDPPWSQPDRGRSGPGGGAWGGGHP
ncbi:MAG TPA: R3H domain-containing nucleic acid-binding protein [Candidatus Dormibacteraeota bacterium]|nr:R3H domain-containing nucleic acid-binding protein [Candidatus Dormibacteraeota bacterium]